MSLMKNKIYKILKFEYKTNEQINEEFLQKYINLCFNCATKRVKYKTERHHILPKKCFSQYSKEEWNIVNLSLFHHILAHYYLFHAFQNKHSLYSLSRVICQIDNTLIVKNLQESDLLLLSKIKEQIRNELKERLKYNHPKLGTKLTIEQKNRISKGQQSEKAKNARKLCKQRKWLYKDDDEKFVLPDKIAELLKDGYSYGRSRKTANKVKEKLTGKTLPQDVKDKIRTGMLALGDKHHMKSKEKREWAKTTVNRFTIVKVEPNTVCYVYNDSETIRIPLKDISLYESLGYKRGKNQRWMTSSDKTMHRVVNGKTEQSLLELGWTYGKK